MWPVIAMAAGSMLVNEMNNRQARKMNQAQGEAAATQTQFSPWTKMGKGSYDHTPEKSTLGAGLQGGMSGASMQQQFNQANMNQQLGQQQLQMNQNMMDQQQPQYTQQYGGGYDSYNPWAKRKQSGSMMG